MPIIKSLRLHDYRASYFKLYHPFSAAPRLTELILYGWFKGWVFPWSQLTKLKVSFTSFGDRIESEELETILSQLRNLEELHVDEVFVWHRNDDGDRRSIRLASLRLLAVRTYPLDILTRIEAPLLEHLCVDGYVHGRDRALVFIEELSSFIRRSSCYIRQLILHNDRYGLLPHLMKLLSSVEELWIKTTAAKSGSFLVKRITQMTDGVCLPNLRHVCGAEMMMSDRDDWSLGNAE